MKEAALSSRSWDAWERGYLYASSADMLPEECNRPVRTIHLVSFFNLRSSPNNHIVLCTVVRTCPRWETPFSWDAGNFPAQKAWNQPGVPLTSPSWNPGGLGSLGKVLEKSWKLGSGRPEDLIAVLGGAVAAKSAKRSQSALPPCSILGLGLAHFNDI